MSEEIDALRAEVAALRAELVEADRHERRVVTRRHLMTGLVGAAAAGATGVVSATPAGADDGDPLTLGADNTSSTSTSLAHDSNVDEPALEVRSNTSTGLFATTDPTWSGPDGGPKRAIYAVAELGVAELSNAIEATAGHGFAVVGDNDASGIPAVHGLNISSGPGLGAVSRDHGPQIVLAREDSATTGAPTTYADEGSIRFDGAGDLWLCVATGEPGTWTRLLREDTAPGRTIPITPFRAIDTRATAGRASGAPVVPGQRKGPLKGGESVTLDLAGVDPIPATASGVIGTANILSPDGDGFLRIMPAGTGTPAASFSWQDGINNANGFTSGLSDTGLRAIAPVSSTVRYHLVIDIAAYIT